MLPDNSKREVISLRLLRMTKPLSALLICLAASAVCCTRPGPNSTHSDAVRSESAGCADSSDGRKRIDINKASAKDLEALEGVGEVLAARVIEHRSRFGKFRRASDIIVVDGFSERKYHAIEHRICAGD